MVFLDGIYFVLSFRDLFEDQLPREVRWPQGTYSDLIL